MTIPEDMSELVDVSIDRVDLVGKAANGHRMLIAKSTAGTPNLISPETVRDLIKEADADPAPAELAVFEDLASILKAGRALSSANESALRNAAEAIQKVLASLPAPEEAPVEKETPVAEETTAETTVEKDAAAAIIADVPVLEVAKGEEPGAVEEVEKADSLLAVYDAKGKLIGVIKPNALTIVDSGDAAPTDKPAEAPAEKAEEPAAEEPFEEAAAESVTEPADEIQPEDGAPAEALGDDEELIPGTETVKSPIGKSAATETTVTQAPDVAALLKEALAPLVEKIAHAADLADEVKVLKERVEAYGREPDDRKSPLLNGATGEAGIAKRSADNDELTTLAKSVELAKESGDPTKLANAQQALAFASILDRFQH
ncbi:hypothetical protein [Pseudarthrobacter cellobiosi]|uniref:hypothetical protein n=1 Tax=Pseudarthrobacter cellobiosi TaxID=2953654 RepID=UPI00208ECC5F|nr:hypothetical protein [Pseudarthrobacter sp. HLT1-5]MCO4257406.1 hypothetical protein [Pseudarthrobacter sp. HLT1-5]